MDGGGTGEGREGGALRGGKREGGEGKGKGKGPQ